MIPNPANLVNDIEAVRIVRNEAVPDGLWQGLSGIGRQKPVARIRIDEKSIILGGINDVPQERRRIGTA